MRLATSSVTVTQTAFLVLSHEAGHQFGYSNPDGIKQGCGGTHGCHAPYGSGSVISYDHQKGGSVRYNVTAEDISHIPGATWNKRGKDRYTVWRSGDPSSIKRWGVWIDHRFRVSGSTVPDTLFGGNFSVVDRITGKGNVWGNHSEDFRPAASATYSGEDNFLGVDLNPDYQGALLEADANLEYEFSSDPTLGLRVNEFEAYYRDSDGNPKWHDHSFSNWGDFQYMMDCEPGGCSSEDVEAMWYANNDGDPAGWVGGEVDDRRNKYAGSFVAEKD